MPALFRHHSSLRCFFCHNVALVDQDPRNFLCHSCGCWNRYSARGEILSDDPAMHDESLNFHSFAKRASPSKDRLPTAYGKGPFCHTCQTNQMLLVNLLSSYLPSPDSPDYHQRLDKLPEYKESLHARYPPVCDSCLPAVEEEIRSKDHMARTKALGGWLKDSKGKDRQRRVSGSIKDRDYLSFEIFAWRVRGFLWVVSLVLATFGYTAAYLQYPIPRATNLLRPVLPILVMISLLWTAWDPTYSTSRRAQLQGRDVRVKGKQVYILLQMTVWCLRFFTSTVLAIRYYKPHFDVFESSKRVQNYFLSTLVVETFVFATSLFVLRVQLPPAIRLIDSKSHTSTLSRSATPIDNFTSRATTPGGPLHSLAEPDLTALSLSSKPIISPPNPVFGRPSLLSNSVQPPTQPNEDMEMDWAPTDPVAYSAFQKRKHRIETPDDGSWLRPQLFFAPEQPTGLEGLFEKTRLADDVPPPRLDTLQSKVQSHLKSWWRVYVLLCIPVTLAIGYRWWFGVR